MRPYFEKMTEIGKALTKAKIKNTEENAAKIKEVEKEISEAAEKIKLAGLPEKKDQ